MRPGHVVPPLPRTAVRVVLLVGLALLPMLTGCASIPRTGPVVSGQEVEVDPQQGLVQIGGDGPSRGESPEQLVSAFLLVAADFSNHHEVARSFLTPGQQLAWRPDASVSVYPTKAALKVKEVGAKASTAGTPSPSPSKVSAGAARADGSDHTGVTTQVSVTTPIAARIDQDGRYQLAAPGAMISLKFGLSKVGDDWRISTLDHGILVSASAFNATFRPYPVYFADPTGRYLVPDLHWFAGTGDDISSPELPTALVRVLLEGPPPWLDGAVTTGAPADTKMAVAAVVVADEVATVDLTEAVRRADTRHRQLLLSQLQATLSRIGQVRITVRGVSFDVPSGSSGGSDSDPSEPDGQLVINPRVDSRPVMIDAKGRLARLNGRTVEVLDKVAKLGVSGANRPAVANDGSAYAVLTADRSKLLLQLPGADVVSLVTSAALTAPSFDPQGWVWSAPGTNSGFVFAATAAGSIRVAAPWLKGAQMISMRISRDGTRAVLAVEMRGHAHLFVTGVLRDPNGKPLSLSQPPAGLFPDLQSVRDLAWVDEDEVVVLGERRGTPGDQARLVQIGGFITDVGSPVPGAESIAAGNGELSVMTGTTKNLMARSGFLWEKVAPGRWPAYPG